MVHALFGRRVNAPLSLLLQHTARQLCGIDIGSVDEEEGVLLYPYGNDVLPEGLLFQIDEKQQPFWKNVIPIRIQKGCCFRLMRNRPGAFWKQRFP